MIRRPTRSTRTDTPFPYTTLFRSALVEGQLIDVDQVGPVHRVGPAKIFVMAEEGIGRSGEVRAGEIPPFARVDDQFVPGDPAGPRLVRVGEEPRRAVGRSEERRVGNECVSTGSSQW